MILHWNTNTSCWRNYRAFGKLLFSPQFFGKTVITQNGLPLLLRLIYGFLKVLVRTALRLYHPRTYIQNPERLRFAGPAIVVSNHPNTLIDALQVASRVRNQVFFLANSSLFKGAFNKWFFNTFYCIPIDRPQDTNGRPLNNTASFERCDQFLSGGGTLYIAPDGRSYRTRRLRPVKSGTARNALSAEQKNDFRLGMQIIPFGLEYEAPARFRSRFIMRIGPPIMADQYEGLFKSDPVGAWRQVTADLEAAMQALVAHTRNEEEDIFLRLLEMKRRAETPSSEDRHFEWLQIQIQTLHQLETQDPEAYQKLLATSGALAGQLHRAGADWSDVFLLQAPKNAFLTTRAAWVLLLPLWLPGYVLHWPILAIPDWLSKKLKLSIEYKSTVQIVAGLLTFPLFFALLMWIFHTQLAPNGWWTLLFTAGMIFSGRLAWWAHASFRRWRLRRHPDLGAGFREAVNGLAKNFNLS